MERELRTGYQLQRETEEARERQASKQAKDSEGKIIKGNGLDMRKIASLPSRDYFQILAKYGHGAFADNEFMADFKKRNPHLTTSYCPDRKRMKSVSR